MVGLDVKLSSYVRLCFLESATCRLLGPLRILQRSANPLRRDGLARGVCLPRESVDLSPRGRTVLHCPACQDADIFLRTHLQKLRDAARLGLFRLAKVESIPVSGRRLCQARAWPHWPFVFIDHVGPFVIEAPILVVVNEIGPFLSSCLAPPQL